MYIYELGANHVVYSNGLKGRKLRTEVRYTPEGRAYFYAVCVRHLFYVDECERMV